MTPLMTTPFFFFPRLYSPELHDARLPIKWKVRHVYVTGALVNSRWFPNNAAVVVNHCLGHDGDHIISVGAVLVVVVVCKWKSSQHVVSLATCHFRPPERLASHSLVV